MEVNFVDGGFIIGDTNFVLSTHDYSVLCNGIKILSGEAEALRFSDEINLRVLIMLLGEKIIRDHCL